jgi:hypothetical protein
MNSPSSQQSDPAGPSSQPRTAPVESEKQHALRRMRIYSHSSLLYWWPVWAVGYVMTLVTYWQGQELRIGQTMTWIHPSSNPGLIFFLVLFLVILITNIVLRGLASGMVLMGSALIAVLLALLGWWDQILGWFFGLKIHLNLGAYFWFSTLMFVVWAVSVFVLDRISYWEIKPGQLTRESLFGAGSKSYNTQGMALEKHRYDLFKHWILGLGSGDLQIRTSGATREQIDVPNVLFIGSKVEAMQRLISEVPDGSEES